MAPRHHRAAGDPRRLGDLAVAAARLKPIGGGLPSPSSTPPAPEGQLRWDCWRHAVGGAGAVDGPPCAPSSVCVSSPPERRRSVSAARTCWSVTRSAPVVGLLGGGQRGAAQELADEGRAGAVEVGDDLVGLLEPKLEPRAVELQESPPAGRVGERQEDGLVDASGARPAPARAGPVGPWSARTGGHGPRRARPSR
jgi:hypothetical protein